MLKNLDANSLKPMVMALDCSLGRHSSYYTKQRKGKENPHDREAVSLSLSLSLSWIIKVFPGIKSVKDMHQKYYHHCCHCIQFIIPLFTVCEAGLAFIYR